MRCSKNQKLIAIAVAENVHTGLHKISTLSTSDSQVYLYVHRSGFFQHISVKAKPASGWFCKRFFWVVFHFFMGS